MRSHIIVKLAAIACGIALAGCASRRPATSVAPSISDREHKIATAEADIARMESLLATLRAEATPDCSQVCGLVANICDLSKRICDLAKQDHAAQLQSRCDDATLRCERARTSAASRCDCQTGAL